jgi:hypothetical protein
LDQPVEPGRSAIRRSWDNAWEESMDDKVEIRRVLCSTEIVNPRSACRRFSRLPVGNQQLVGAFGLFCGGSLFGAFCLLL